MKLVIETARLRLHQFTRKDAAFILELVNDSLNLSPVLAITDPNNQRSIKLLQKLGMQFLKQFTIIDDEPEVMLF